MKCDLYQPLLSAYSDGVLDGAERQAVREHVNLCADCEHELRTLQSLKSLLASCDSVSAPSDMVRHIFAAVQSAPPLPSLTCDEALFLLSPYMDDELDETAARRVLNHVAVCDACYAELRALERQSIMLGALPETPAPAALKEAILERVAQLSAGWLMRLLHRLRTAVTLQPQWSYGVATAAVVLMGAVFASHFRPTAPPVAERPYVAAAPKTAAPQPLKQDKESPSVPEKAGSTARLAESRGSKVETVASDAGKSAPVVRLASLTAKKTFGVPPSKAHRADAKIKTPLRNEAAPESLLVNLDKGTVKPSLSQLDLPEEPTPTMIEMLETVSRHASETNEDVSSLLASAPTVSYHAGGLNLPEENETSASPAKVAAAPRKIPLGSTILPLPKGDSFKGQYNPLKGRRIDDLPRRVVIA
ncbi:MAG: zf-HC2 domain-containing protein, partial [Abditibacteriales bacterium]|nr:zf-HC2 domain-containing protein [Abditibacteriales bacterium]MDW8364882.1 zf-HC2 domain-containing protein [Abditibacteriales bacterium]